MSEDIVAIIQFSMKKTDLFGLFDGFESGLDLWFRPKKAPKNFRALSDYNGCFKAAILYNGIFPCFLSGFVLCLF